MGWKTSDMTAKQLERVERANDFKNRALSVPEASQRKIGHKFNAQPTEYDGIRFDSKKEANYYLVLKQLQEAGEIVFFLRQVPFDLPGNTKYRVDFQIFWTDKTVTFHDVKGMRTKDFIKAKKQVEALYPVEIVEVR